jgi:hypothetical protein
MPAALSRSFLEAFSRTSSGFCSRGQAPRIVRTRPRAAAKAIQPPVTAAGGRATDCCHGGRPVAGRVRLSIRVGPGVSAPHSVICARIQDRGN